MKLRNTRSLHPLLVVLFVLVFFCSPLAAGTKKLTVQRLYSEPSLSGHYLRGAVWLPDGSGFTYLRKNPISKKFDLWKYSVKKKNRTLFLNLETFEKKLQQAAPDSMKQKVHLSFRRIQWLPDGRRLLVFLPKAFVILDPLHKSLKAHWISGHIQSPQISPDGRRVAFTRRYDLYLYDLATDRETRLTFNGSEAVRNATLDWVYPEELDLYRAFWWAPDGKKIAYLQMDERPVKQFPIVDFLPLYEKIRYERYPKAGTANPVVRVGVVRFEQRPRTRWMDTGSDTNVYIPRVRWLPNGKTLAIQRLDRSQKHLDLLLADAATGKSRVILRETDPYWVNIKNDWYFFKSKPWFLWGSERSGFRHLYLYTTSGKLLHSVTKGPWQVEQLVHVDEKHGWVYYTSTEKDVRERHFYKIRLSGKSKKRLTRRDGTHRVSLSPNGRYFLDTFSTVAFPPKTALLSTNGTFLDWIEKNDVSELADYKLTRPQLLTLKADDGATLFASLIRQPNFNPAQKYPVLIHVYGGPHAQMVWNAWGGSTYLWHELMAQRGYLIFSLDNRGSWGRGHRWEASIYHHLGRKELADQLAGVRYLKTLPYVDSTRIGIWGWSYGGYMTLYALLNAPTVFKAGFAVAPVTDWRFYDTIYTERYMGTPQENPDGYRDSSPVNQAGHLRAKLFIAHGTSDDNVHFQNTVQMIEKFIQENRQVGVFFYPGKTHGIGGRADRIHLFTRLTAFFLNHL